MLDYIVCALRNIGRKKFRSGITIAGIAIGVASVVIISFIGTGAKETVSTQLDSLGINGINISMQKQNMYDTTAMLSDNDLKICSRISGSKFVMPLIMQVGNAVLRSTQKNALLWGVGSNAGNMISLKISYGRMFSKSQVSSHAKVCLIDDTFANEVYKRRNITGKTISLFMGNDYETFKICGIVESGSSLLYNFAGDYIPTFVYLPYTTAEDLRLVNGYDQIMIKNNSNIDMDVTGNNVVSALAKFHNSNTYTFSNMVKQKNHLSSILSIVTLVISAIGAISIIVAGLGIMTVLLVSVNERTKEIGIKKAIGAKKSCIMLEFLCEALAMSVIGAILGVTSGLLIASGIAKFLNFSYVVESTPILLAIAFAISIGAVFGVYPAYKAANLEPVEALRQE